MADTKISALPASTTPLAGTEVLPIVQSGATKQVSVANLTAGRAVSAASVTASTGNFVVGASGQGVDFSATPGTGTSELLSDYEEGTWTPVDDSGAGLTLSAYGDYIKIGSLVVASFNITYPSTANTANSRIGGLPFTSRNVSGRVTDGFSIRFTDRLSAIALNQTPGTSYFFIITAAPGAFITNAGMSGITVQGIITYTA
jgi:hypothetical protein